MLVSNNYSPSKEEALFAKIAKDWWDANGPFKMLHKFNKIRIPYITDSIKKNNYKSLKKLSILDIGCGGGLVSEELAKLGAFVTGIDTNKKAIKIAQLHAKQENLEINYEHSSVENFTTDKTFDVILLIEVLEHVDDINTLINKVTKFLKPNGLIFFSTINRNLKSLILAKYIAEYILKWLPKGIHDYDKFIKPFELQKILLTNNFSMKDIKGVNYNVHYNTWDLSSKPTMNYIGYAKSIHNN